ncbi:MAG: DUF1667 domain-containing protein [Firmicutes bacterium]|nr:DUF1667 domain-containing protein [Bacillota bacterium]
MREIICILCPNGCHMKVANTKDKWVIKGNLCNKGRKFAIDEIKNPKRTVCSTVKTRYSKVPRLPVKTDDDIPKEYIFPLMKLINKIVIDKPMHSGEIIIEDVFKTGVNVITTSNLFYLLGIEKDG